MLARQVAEAEVDLRRVQLASHQILSQAGSMSVIPGPLLTNTSAMPEAAQEEFAPLTPLADKLATILAQQAKAIEKPCTATNGVPGRDANLPFEPSMRRADRNDF
jgi:hypothetical protein